MRIVELTDANFFAATLAHKPVLVDFFATWCGPCQAMLGTLPEVAEAVGSTGIVAKLDVDRNKATAAIYKIQNLPTLILLRRGEIVKRWVGVQDVATLAAEVKRAAETSGCSYEEIGAMSDAGRIAELEAETELLKLALCKIQCTLKCCVQLACDCDCDNDSCGMVGPPT